MTNESRELIRAYGVGRLAAELKISAAAVSRWKRVPATRAHEVGRILKVPPEQLRPDVFKRAA